MAWTTRLLFWMLLAAMAGTLAAHADGFIVPEPVPGVPRPPLLTVKYHHVDVVVRNGVAVTRIDQVFHNEFHRPLEGTYIFPLPSDAAVSDFTMWVDGKPLAGRVLEKNEARRIYESYLRRRMDPALLEYLGRDMFQARVFPVPAKGERRIELRYTQVVPFDGGVYAYRYPLDTERFSARPLREVAVRVTIHSPARLKAIYSPTHDIDVQRQGDYQATVSYEQKDIRPDRDFQLYWGVSDKDFGLNLITCAPDSVEGGKGKGDGFFLLMLAPRTGLAESRRAAKDITFVLDTSGSMSGRKLEQARRALQFVLENLNPADRFALIAFSGEVERFRPDLVPATPDSVGAARRFVDELQARGGTNIHEALLTALRVQKPRAGVPAMVVFLTDGLPTVGTTDEAEILRDVGKARAHGTRIFVFGVGDDVNTHLLDRISGDHGGVSEYVRPEEDLEVKVSSFYTKIATPVLADLELDYGGAEAYDVYPKRLPDLFAGSQIVVLGRYRRAGRFTVSLKGSVGGQARTFTYPAQFGGQEGRAEFLPRLWATRKVGFLLDELRLHGENKELVDEITRLGLEYGIVTPYTSSLVEEEPRAEARDAVRDLEAALPGRRDGGAGGAQGAPAAPAVTGRAATSAARQLRAAKEAVREDDRFGSVRHVEGRTFRLSRGAWVDVLYRPEMKRREVRFASDEYFALIQRTPKLARYFALGERVVVVWEGEALEVVP